MTTEITENATKDATASAQGAEIAREKATSKKSGAPKKGAPKGRKTAKVEKAVGKLKKQPKAAKEPARTGSKASSIVDLLRRAKGATLAEIMEATGWQAHSVRGFVSGTLGKKMGLAVSSERLEDGTRVYRIAK